MKKIILLLLFNIVLFSAALESVKQSIKSRFLSEYRNMQIKSIEIQPISKLPKDFKTYTFEEISLSNANLKRSSGNCSAIYLKNGKKKRVYLRYKIKAYLNVFKTNSDIPRSKLLKNNLLKKHYIEFENFYKQPIDKSYIHKYRTKRFLKEGSIVYKSDVSKILAVKRNDLLIAALNDGVLVVEFSVQALQAGDIGDVIRVRNNSRKVLKAKIISKKRVEILE